MDKNKFSREVLMEMNLLELRDLPGSRRPFAYGT